VHEEFVELLAEQRLGHRPRRPRGRHSEGEPLARRAFELRELASATNTQPLQPTVRHAQPSSTRSAKRRRSARSTRSVPIEAPVRFIHTQGLTDRPLEVDELFAPSTLEEYRI
jgi:hypothetical protein